MLETPTGRGIAADTGANHDQDIGQDDTESHLALIWQTHFRRTDVMLWGQKRIARVL